MYKTDNGYLVCEDTKEGFLTDFKLEGRTVKNIVGVNGKTSVTLNNTLKSKQYTLLENVKANTPMYFRVNVTGKKAPLNGLKLSCYNTDGTYTFYTLATGVYEQTAIITNPKEINAIALYMPQTEFDADITTNITYEKLQLTLVENNGYFEGLKSVGQDVDKLVVSSIGENLFDGEYIADTKAETNGAFTSSKGSVVSKNFTKVKPNINISLKDYTHNRTPLILEYDINKNFISRTGTTNNTYTLKSNTYYIKIYLFDASLVLNCDNLKIMLTLGTIPVSYKSFETDKKEILYLDTVDSTWKKPVLRGIWSNGLLAIGDTIYKHADNKYYYHKIMSEIIFNGSEISLVARTIADTNVLAFDCTINDIKVGSSTQFMSDKFSTSITHTLEKEEIIFNTVNKFIIYISKTKCTDLATFKTWLQANPVTVVYELAEEQIYECTHLVLDAFDNETMILVESGSVSPSLEFNAIDGLVDVVNVVDNLSNGLESVKSRLAIAITSKGVETSENDSFNLLTNKINNIEVEKHLNIPSWYTPSNIYIKGSKLPIWSSSLSSCRVGTKIYVIHPNGTWLKCYDTTNDTWTDKTALSVSRNFGRACAVGDKIYFIGGRTTMDLRDVNCYDTVTDTWSTKASMISSKHSVTLIVVGTKIYVINGERYNPGMGSSYPVGDVECYDTITDTWSTKATSANPRSFQGVGVYGDNIFSLGGVEESKYISANAYVYNMVTNTWSSTTGLTVQMGLGGSTQVGNKVYMFCRNDIFMNGVYSTAISYDLVTKQTSYLLNYPAALSCISLAAMDNIIYCFGGSASQITIDSVIGYLI